MYTLNQVQLIGRLGQSPSISRKDNKKPIASFSLATEESWKNAEGQWETHTEWHRIVAYNGLVDIIEKHITKGQPIYLQGRMRSREWQDAEGLQRRITEVIATEVKLLPRASKNSDVNH